MPLEIDLRDLDPGLVEVEVYADPIQADGCPIRHSADLKGVRPGTNNIYIYEVQAPASRPLTDYTARIIPRIDGVAIPLEAPQIYWIDR